MGAVFLHSNPITNYLAGRIGRPFRTNGPNEWVERMARANEDYGA